MGWADRHIERLRNGETVQFRPHGRSMQGRVESGQLCTVQPVTFDSVRKNDIVLCTVRGAQYLHLVKQVGEGRCLIGNNKGGTNGWIGPGGLHGRCTAVE